MIVPPAIVVAVDRDGTPLARASAHVGTVTYPADVKGRIVIGTTPTGARVIVAAPGCASQTIRLDSAHPTQRVTLQCAPRVIGSVRVATGSLESRHELPYATSLLDRTQIAMSAATTGDALLAMLPGFDRNRSNSAFSNYGLNRVSLAGAGNDRGLLPRCSSSISISPSLKRVATAKRLPAVIPFACGRASAPLFGRLTQARIER